MIGIEEQQDLLKVHVFGEFSVDDFREFEDAMTDELRFAPKVRLVLDLTQMSGFTVDMAWEDIKFTRAHAHDFKRIAVVSSDQWISWMGWLNGLFTDAELQVFQDLDDATAWANAG